MKSSHSSSHSTHSDTHHPLFQRFKNTKFTSISINQAEDFDPLINIFSKDCSNIFDNILPQLKHNDPTPTFPAHENPEAIWDDSEELQNESLKNRKIEEDDKLVNISVIEKENICGDEDTLGDRPTFFYSKISDENHESSLFFVETKAEVINGDEILNMTSIVSNLNLNGFSVLPKHNQTFMIKNNRDKSREKNLKKREYGIKVKPVKIGKLQLISSLQLKSTKPIRKSISLNNVFKPSRKSDLSSFKPQKPTSSSQVPDPGLLTLSAKSKTIHHKKPSPPHSLTCSSKPTPSPPPALPLSLNPYLQEFKKPILSSLLPSKSRFQTSKTLPSQNPSSKKKRIKIF